MNMCMPLPASDTPSSTKSYQLWKSIAVIRVIANEEGDLHYGGISELPKGAEVDLCGGGFNERTVKVHWRGEFFFVFLQDLECPVLSAFIE